MSKIILIGCGCVGSCFLEVISTVKTDKTVKKYDKIVIFDMISQENNPCVLLAKKVYKIELNTLHITPDNIYILLDVINKDDLVIDVSYNIACFSIIETCLQKGANYINTSVERWPLENENDVTVDFMERALQTIHNKIRKIGQNYNAKSSVVVTHGMNPGLISHLTFYAIHEVAKQVLRVKYTKELETAYNDDNFPMMCYLLGIETIHCSENDTQIAQNKLCTESSDTFTNTWGSYSFYSEGVDPVQIGIGTNEDINMSYVVSDNEIIIKKRGIDVISTSYVPPNEIKGMLISHSENDTLSSVLTLKNGDEVIYRPSVYYVYSPCQDAWKSIDSVKKNNYEMLAKKRVLKGYELTGKDSVGVLLIFRSDPRKSKSEPISYWCGSILSTDQTREMGLYYSGPTSVQVIASILSVITYIDKGKKGVLFPEDLPYKKVVSDCMPFLGTFFSDFVPYKKTKLELIQTEQSYSVL